MNVIQTWLATDEQIAQIPVGIHYAILCTNPSLFGGRKVIALAEGVTIVGMERAPEAYPNGTPIYEDGYVFDWITNSDPLPEATDAQVIQSATIRGLKVY